MNDNFWTDCISFYFDGVGFVSKTNLHGEAKAINTMAWRKANEGLLQSTKGKKEGSGGRMANFFVAIAYNKGVVCCEQYLSSVTGDTFAAFVREHFPDTFAKSANPGGKMFLKDGDPRQNSKAAREAMSEIGCSMFATPPCSPDINPMENMFNIVRKELFRDALTQEIRKESYEQFCLRVKHTIENFSLTTINKAIESMNKQMRLIIEGKGCRTKY